MSRDDHIDDPHREDPLAGTAGNDPGPDDAIEPGEAGKAESFARLVDRMIGEQDLPPAMDSEERALLAVAGLVRASTRTVELAEERSRALIDDVIVRATAARETGPIQRDERPIVTPDAGPPAQQKDAPGITDLGAYRRARRVLPWTVAGLAAAAALVLVLVRPDRVPTGGTLAQNRPLPTEQQSRPADRLIGEIARADVGHARERIDMIYADRMSGYRARHFGGVR